MFVFCGWGFSNQVDVMLETSISCDTAVGLELWLAILSTLLCPETDCPEYSHRTTRLCVYFN